MIELIVNNENAEASNFFDTLKCPLIVDVESSIVLKNSWMSVELSFSSSIHKFVAVVRLT